MVKEWRGLMNGDVSHSSETKLLTVRRDVRLFLCFSFSFVVLSAYSHLDSCVGCGFVLSRLFFSFRRGASTPEWVKPAAEGGGFPGNCYLFNILLLGIYSAVICLVVFLYS
jgi:hypothetical protein